MKRFAALFLTAVLSLGVLSGCSAGGETEDQGGTQSEQPADTGSQSESVPAGPAEGGTLISVIPNDPSTFNPGMAMDEGAGIVTTQMYNNLVMMDTDYNIIPDLADSWEYNEDYTVLTLHLNEDAKWHDGEDFSAEDVVYTINTITEQAWTASMSLVNVEKVEAADENTVVFTSKTPDVTLLSNLAWFGMGMLPKHVHENTDWASNPVFDNMVGTGPFKFSSYQTGVAVELEANKDYFRDGPYVDKLIFQIVPDAQTEMWKNGEVDIMYSGLTGPEATAYDNDPAYSTRLNMLCNRVYFTFNFQKEDNPFLDIRLRQALSYAMDREQIYSVGAGGIGAPAEYYISPMYDWALNEDAKIPGRDLDKVRTLLEEAGYTPDENGIYFSFEVITFGYTNELTVAQANLKEAGIDMTVTTMDMTAWMDKVIIAGDYYVTLLAGDQGPDISSIGNRVGTGGSVNVGMYSNPEVDELLAQGTQTGDPEARAEIYKEIQSIMAEELPMVILTESGLKYAVASTVHGVPMIDDQARPHVAKMAYPLVWLEQ